MLLQAKDVYAGYGTRHVLHAINLELQAGERVVLLGPNGSGKSTLLKVLSKGLIPSKGSVTVEGLPLADLSFSDIARRIGFVPQEEPSRFPFSVRDVVTMGRLARSNGLFDTQEDRVVATEAMRTADCIDLETRPFPELSGGERQRVLIARALAQQAPVLLLDEPTSHLDPAHQIAVADLVGSLSQSGVATIAAVHDLNLASRIATRAILLDQGTIVLDGDVQSVLTNEQLDRTYQVQFLRVEAPDGGLILLPRSPTS